MRKHISAHLFHWCEKLYRPGEGRSLRFLGINDAPVLKILPKRDGCKGLGPLCICSVAQGKREKEGEGINAGEHRFMLKMTQLVQL